ncbi:MAG: FAD-dependent oxidoreductase [Chloroflexota bacterium]|nr:FAD-dependent oxidoreductase [Dehalococcoidia bacterium]MDW8255179.1 FAD-dependent oxidoreductase [Chloroflexota bacterium]
METIVVVGANLAGGRAVETLRGEGFDGRVVLIGAERDRPYERPPLSKEYLAGAKERSALFLRPAHYYQDERIELILGVRAERLDAREKTVYLADGRAVPYDKLLIATGAAPRRLNVPGADLPNIFVLRTIADADAIRLALRPGARVVVVGAGFIGMETAATCRQLGAAVTVVEPLSAPLAAALPRAIGEQLAAIHRAAGVQFRFGEKVVGFRGHGRVEQALTDAGAALDCDLAVVGVGVVPEDRWLEGAGIARQNGILVDEFCRTSMPDVWAAGDVANFWHPGLRRRLRVEHYENAQQQGVHAAQSMLGKGVPYAPLLSFWSDQYDRNLQLVGHPEPEDQLVWRGRPPHEPWAVFFLRDGRLAAALTVNMVREQVAARQLIRKGVAVDPAALADPATDLRALARSL